MENGLKTATGSSPLIGYNFDEILSEIRGIVQEIAGRGEKTE